LFIILAIGGRYRADPVLGLTPKPWLPLSAVGSERTQVHSLTLGDSKVEIRAARGCCELRIRRFGV
jgi:hypothetical protein